MSATAAPRADRRRGPGLGRALAPAVAPGVAHDLAAARVVPRDLSRVARGDADHGVLERRSRSRTICTTSSRSQNFRELFTATYLQIIWRTIVLAALVTSPTRSSRSRSRTSWHASRPQRVRSLLFMAVLLPLWASYLARIYAWIVILTKDGTLNWAFRHLGLPAAQHRLHEHRDVARVLVHLAAVHDHPVYTALERIPDSLIEASADLGARQLRTLRDVVLPLALPASSPARSSRSRSRSATSSRRCSSGARTRTSSGT